MMSFALILLLTSSAFADPSIARIADDLKNELKEIEALAVEARRHKDITSGTDGVALQQAACISTASSMVDAVQDVADSCGSLPQTLIDSLRDFESPIDTLNDFCTEFNEDCGPSVSSLLALTVEAIDTCRSYLDTDIPLSDLRPGRLVGNAIAIQMLAQMLCLQVDDQLCLVTVHEAIRATNSTTFLQCASDGIFTQNADGIAITPGQPDSTQLCGTQESGCSELVQDLFDEAGCCFTGYLAILQASVALVVPEVETFTFPQTFCGGDIVFCPEVASYATEVLGDEKFVLEDPNPESTEGPNSAAEAVVSLGTLAAGVLVSHFAQY